MTKQEEDAVRRLAARWIYLHSPITACVDADAKVVRCSNGYIVCAEVFVRDADVKQELKNATPKT